MSGTTRYDLSGLQDWITERVAGYLEISPDRVDPDVPLVEFGLDSVYALSLCGEVEDELNLTVEPTLIRDYPTIRDLARFLTGELAARRDTAA